jgi:hypothetical protein
LLFSKRKELEKEYYEWLYQNKIVKDCPFNVVTFLDSKGLLREKIIVKKSKIA